MTLPREKRIEDFPKAVFSKENGYGCALVAHSKEKHGFNVYQKPVNNKDELKEAKKEGFTDSYETLVKPEK